MGIFQQSQRLDSKSIMLLHAHFAVILYMQGVFFIISFTSQAREKPPVRAAQGNCLPLEGPPRRSRTTWICSYTFEATLISISPILPSATQPIHIHCTPTPSQKYEFLIEFPSNTNMNTIRLFQYDRIRIRILFGFSKMTEYEYEYYSAFQK